MSAIATAAEILGSQIAIARVLGISAGAVSQLVSGHRSTPPDRCPAIEFATEGRVTCEELRPDVRWQRVPDVAWPHALGRPCIDVAAPEREAKVA
jgi:DNA-binding transcriptional regulator YdaS (Cro superfamily)